MKKNRSFIKKRIKEKKVRYEARAEYRETNIASISVDDRRRLENLREYSGYEILLGKGGSSGYIKLPSFANEIDKIFKGELRVDWRSENYRKARKAMTEYEYDLFYSEGPERQFTSVLIVRYLYKWLRESGSNIYFNESDSIHSIKVA